MAKRARAGVLMATATRHALVFMALVVLGSAAAGCAGFGATKTTTVTSSDGGPVVPPDMTIYRGTTDQGLPISFAVTGNTVSELTFGWRARCVDGQVRSNSIGLGGGAVHAGSFSLGGVLETGGVAQVTGEVSGDQAVGTLSRSRGTAFGVDCDVRGVAWRAQADRPSGQSS